MARACVSPQIKRFLQPLIKAVAVPYGEKTMQKLAAYGLRYDDLYDPMRDEVSAATQLTRRTPAHQRSGTVQIQTQLRLSAHQPRSGQGHRGGGGLFTCPAACTHSVLFPV